MTTDYDAALDWLYNAAPPFHKLGAHAYKPGLERITAMAEAFGNPHKKFRAIHVAGTNGKGSTAHTLAAILQSSGLRTGLFTSPHLVDFRERIRIDGRMITREEVVDFINKIKGMPELPASSFFEMTTLMAFDAFARAEVDIAVIEVGLGGRLDSTNIIEPELGVITSISLDHTEQLGDTLGEIAAEKGGIIKPSMSNGVVISGWQGNEAVADAFRSAAARNGVDIEFAMPSNEFDEITPAIDGISYSSKTYDKLRSDLPGACQPMNMAGVVAACRRLGLSREAVAEGMAHTCDITGLQGRWALVSREPLTVIDTGHNIGGWEQLAPQIAACPAPRHIVCGFVADKHLEPVLEVMRAIPDARYYFAAASTPRAMAADVLAERAREAGLKGEAYPTPEAAYRAACEGEPGLVFVGGSNFLVGDLLPVIARN